jgi:uncharacterized protein YbaR (Trm112 family)
MNSILVATIICPNCHAELEAYREACPHCRTSLRVSPERSTARKSEEGSKPVLDRPWIIAVLLLHLGFLGIPLYWKSSYSVSTRIMICLVSVVYTVFAVGFILLVGSYILRQFRGG